MNSTISEYIKTSRLELGLTQDELAQRAGISVRYLCDIENDHGIPSDWVYESLQHSIKNSLPYTQRSQASKEMIKMF